jgi:hypothetical protein
MVITARFSPEYMEKYYLVHADINCYAWFKSYSKAHDFLMGKWVDRRIAREVYMPTK